MQRTWCVEKISKIHINNIENRNHKIEYIDMWLFYGKNRFREGDEGSNKQTLSLRNQKLLLVLVQNDAPEEQFSDGGSPTKSQPLASFLHRHLTRSQAKTKPSSYEKTKPSRNEIHRKKKERKNCMRTDGWNHPWKIEDLMEAAARERGLKEAFRQGCLMHQWLVWEKKGATEQCTTYIRDRNGWPGKTKPHFTHKEKIFFFFYYYRRRHVYDSMEVSR